MPPFARPRVDLGSHFSFLPHCPRLHYCHHASMNRRTLLASALGTPVAALWSAQGTVVFVYHPDGTTTRVDDVANVDLSPSSRLRLTDPAGNERAWICPSKWIALEHNGRFTFNPRPSSEWVANTWGNSTMIYHKSKWWHSEHLSRPASSQEVAYHLAKCIPHDKSKSCISFINHPEA